MDSINCVHDFKFYAMSEHPLGPFDESKHRAYFTFECRKCRLINEVAFTPPSSPDELARTLGKTLRADTSGE